MNTKESSLPVVAVALVSLAAGACTPARQPSAALVASPEYERAACAEVPDQDRDQGPFARRDRIVGVEELREKTYPKAPPQPIGAAVYLRATPGVTEQWVGRVIDCHLAHRAVAGDRAVDRDSPLYVADTSVHVSSTPTAFRVAITSYDLDAARSVIEKANRLAAR
jgi:hypothetical protein